MAHPLDQATVHLEVATLVLLLVIDHHTHRHLPATDPLQAHTGEPPLIPLRGTLTGRPMDTSCHPISTQEACMALATGTTCHTMVKPTTFLTTLTTTTGKETYASTLEPVAP